MPQGNQSAIFAGASSPIEFVNAKASVKLYFCASHGLLRRWSADSVVTRSVGLLSFLSSQFGFDGKQKHNHRYKEYAVDDEEYLHKTTHPGKAGVPQLQILASPQELQE